MKIRLSAMIVGLLLCSWATSAEAQTATCRVYGETSFTFQHGPHPSTTTFFFRGYTMAGQYLITGPTIPCDPVPFSYNDNIRVEVWVDGAQSFPWCYNPASPTGYACLLQQQYQTVGNVTAEGEYWHTGGLASGTWCTQANSTYWDTDGTEASYTTTSWDCKYIFPPSQEEEPELYEPDPILIPTDLAQTFKLTDAANGVLFDINADGVLDQTAWTQAGTALAFLAYDRNGNGRIDNGSELFGNYTLSGATNGFDALARTAPIVGPTGWIDEDDPIYKHLLLWTDLNHNGVSEPDELRPASDLLTRVGLGFSVHERKDGNGNLFRYRGWATRRTEPGKNPVRNGNDDVSRRITIYDVIFTR